MTADHDLGDDLGRRLAAADAALPPAASGPMSPAVLLAQARRRMRCRALAAVGAVALAALWLTPRQPPVRPPAAAVPGHYPCCLAAGLDALADRLQRALAADRAANAAARARAAATAVDRHLAEARAAAALAALTPLPTGRSR